MKLALGGAVCTIGIVKLTQLALGLPSNIDLLLFSAELQTLSRMLMAPNTALALALLGGALMLSTRNRRSEILAAQLLAAGSLAVASAGLIAYGYGAFALVEFTAALTGIVTSPTLGGAMACQFLPIISLYDTYLRCPARDYGAPRDGGTTVKVCSGIKRSPFWVATATQQIVYGHNSIFKSLFINFVRALVAAHASNVDRSLLSAQF